MINQCLYDLNQIMCNKHVCNVSKRREILRILSMTNKSIVLLIADC